MTTHQPTDPRSAASTRCSSPSLLGPLDELYFALFGFGSSGLGFSGAVDEVYADTRHQRCWFHKTGNVLYALPKSLQGKAKAELQAVWMAPTRREAHRAFDRFIVTYQVKYPKATDKLIKDREALLAFYDFPAENLQHLRTTNPIESTFA